MKKFFFNVILAFAFIATAYANQSELLSRVETRYKEFTTFEAHIVQTNYFTQLGYSLDSLGQVYMQDKNVVIEYHTPFYQFVKLVDDELTIYLDYEKTAIISHDKDMFTQTVLQFSEILNNELKFIDKNNSLLEFEVLKDFDFLSNMRIFINESTELIEKTTYTDESENIISVTFNNQAFNQNLSKQIESFKIPNDAMIIRQN